MRRLEEPAAEGVVVARAPRELGLAPAELGLEVGQARVAAGDAQLERLAAAVVVVVVTPPRTMPIAAAAVPVGEQGGGAVDFLSGWGDFGPPGEAGDDSPLKSRLNMIVFCFLLYLGGGAIDDNL